MKSVGKGALEVLEPSENDPRLVAMTTGSLAGLFAENPESSRRDIYKLKKDLERIVIGGNGVLPKGSLVKDARIICDLEMALCKFNDATGRYQGGSTAKVEYHDTLSRDVEDYFCRAMPMPLPKKTYARLDDLLVHLSQIFDLKHKASYVLVGRRKLLRGLALGHVSEQSQDYARFRDCIYTAEYWAARIALEQPNAVGRILTEAHLGGVDREKVQQFIPVLNSGRFQFFGSDNNMGELPKASPNPPLPPDTSTLTIEHDNQLLF
jgi:hypothetical protein